MSSTTATEPLESIALVIDGVPSSANRRLRMHWRDRAREDDAMHWLLKAAIGRSTHSCKHQGRVARVFIHFVMRGNEDDEDNRTARAKGLIDALTKEGVIQDDSPKVCRFAPFTRERSSGRQHTIITVEYYPHW